MKRLCYGSSKNHAVILDNATFALRRQTARSSAPLCCARNDRFNYQNTSKN